MDVGRPQPALPTVTEATVEEPMQVDYPAKVDMWLCDYVYRTKGYTILRGEGVETNALPKALRARLIHKEALDAFYSKSEKQNWTISTYRGGSREVEQVAKAKEYQDVIDTLQGMSKQYHLLEEQYDEDEDQFTPFEFVSELSAARRIGFAHGQIELEACYPGRKRPEIFLCDPNPSLKFGSLQVELPDLPDSADGKFIIVLFDRPVKDARSDVVESKPVASGKSKAGAKKAQKKMAKKIDPVHLTPISSHRSVTVDSVNLSPQEWALFRKNGSNWDMEFKSVRQPEELIPNPLLRESGPVVVNRHDVLLSHENDGELYLNRSMLTHLYGKKVAGSMQNLTDDEKTAVPAWHYRSTLDSFDPLKKMGNRYHFFLERPNSGHTIGAYVNANAADNEVHIYLHETEGATDAMSRLIRRTVIKKMSDLYPDRKIKLFYPKDMLQRDFVSCGVFAFKSMSFFRKNADEMDHWMESMKSEAASDGEVGEVVIPFQQLKPGLLKEYHYALNPHRREDPRLSEEQRKTVVNKKGETLEQYLTKFERQVPRYGREGKTTINTGSFYHRYKMIETYQSDVEERQKLLASVQPMPQPQSMEVAGPSRKRKREEEPTLYECPQDIIDSYELADVNLWLTEQGDDTVTEKEWSYVERYDRHIGSKKPTKVFKEKHPRTYEWVKQARKIDPSTPKGALMQHWLLGKHVVDKPAKKRSAE